MSDTYSRQSVGTETVELVIPCRPEYVGVARLAILGIASRMDFSLDEIEDVRLAVGEACTHAVERAGKTAATLRITSQITPEALVIEVSDNIPADAPQSPPSEDAVLLADVGIDQEGMGVLLMGLLVDDVQIETEPSGTHVRLTKYAPE